jgi:alkylation response protein AidB-like acyl-CoA dehydrogenase
MSNAPHYKANIRDIEFNLFEYLKIQTNYLGKKEYENIDEDGAKELLGTFKNLCEQEICNTFYETDKVPLALDSQGNVSLPPQFYSCMKKFYQDGWDKIDTPEHLGGYGVPATVAWATFELLSGANPCLALYTVMGPVVSRVIDSFGTEKQKNLFVKNMLDKNWGGTMVLTEPDAGSDVGSARTKAKHLKEDLYEIDGVKRFITNGDFNVPENIIHLVLARPEGAGLGTKGLSLFVVPKFMVNEDGSLGARNGVFCTNLEKKMGLKGSATCEMTFGGHGKQPAIGYLVGEVHDGIRQMFQMIEHARMAVGTKSMSTLSTAYLNALEYAKIRVQGPDLTKMLDKSSPRVRIIQHPDVRRMLLQLKSHAEGMRALCLYTATTRDEIVLNQENKEQTEKMELLNDFLLPLVKGYSSDKTFDLLAVALQVFGGSGYCQDYPIEQYIRDQKIDTLYEGTTQIQAQDLIFRKIMKDKGATLNFLFEKMKKSMSQISKRKELEFEFTIVANSMENLQKMLGAIQKKSSESVYHIGLHGNRILHAVSETVIGWLLLDHASLAFEKMPGAGEKDKFFYEGKISSCRYFAREVLPNIESSLRIIESADLSTMNLAEEGF